MSLSLYATLVLAFIKSILRRYVTSVAQLPAYFELPSRQSKVQHVRQFARVVFVERDVCLFDSPSSSTTTAGTVSTQTRLELFNEDLACQNLMTQSEKNLGPTNGSLKKSSPKNAPQSPPETTATPPPSPSITPTEENELFEFLSDLLEPNVGPTSHRKHIGQVIAGKKEEYTIRKFASSGSYGSVFFAESKRKTVHAVKILSKNAYMVDEFDGVTDATDDSKKSYGWIDDIHNEINVLRVCRDAKSPFLIIGNLFLQDFDFYYFVMPAYTMDLFERLNSAIESATPLTYAERMWYTRQLVAAVSALHSLDWAHLDIKPENVMIKENGYLCLVDFGSSTNLDVMECRPSGTPTYCAEEVTYAPSDDPHMHGFFRPKLADVYSLGRTIADVFIAAKVHDGSDLLDIMDCVGSVDLDAFDMIHWMMQDAEFRFDLTKVKESTLLRDTNWHAIESQVAVAPFFPPDLTEVFTRSTHE